MLSKHQSFSSDICILQPIENVKLRSADVALLLALKQTIFVLLYNGRLLRNKKFAPRIKNTSDSIHPTKLVDMYIYGMSSSPLLLGIFKVLLEYISAKLCIRGSSYFARQLRTAFTTISELRIQQNIRYYALPSRDYALFGCHFLEEV